MQYINERCFIVSDKMQQKGRKQLEVKNEGMALSLKNHFSVCPEEWGNSVCIEHKPF